MSSQTLCAVFMTIVINDLFVFGEHAHDADVGTNCALYVWNASADRFIPCLQSLQHALSNSVNGATATATAES